MRKGATKKKPQKGSVLKHQSFNPRDKKDKIASRGSTLLFFLHLLGNQYLTRLSGFHFQLYEINKIGADDG